MSLEERLAKAKKLAELMGIGYS